MTTELVLYNGSVHTMDRRQPLAEALLVRGKRILAVGPSRDVLPLASSAARRVDLRGRTVLPGFEDAHVHFTGYGLRLQRVDLGGAGTLEEALERVRRGMTTIAVGDWLLGGGWNHNVWPEPTRPTRHDLDHVAANTPVALGSKDGHSLWLNSAALCAAGISATTPDPPGGQILRDAAGELTGIITERAQDLVWTHIPALGRSATTAAARAAMAYAACVGVTSIHNCEGAMALSAFEQLEGAGDLTVRVWQMIPHEELGSALAVGLRTGFGNSRLRVGHVKMFADGALGSRTAEMLAPYEEEPGVCGVAATPSAELYEGARRAAEAGLASAIHAIGDAAVRRVLDVYERLAREGLSAGLRQRIEHVQLLSPEDLPRLAQLGVVASMQPIHATQDMLMADRHWGVRARWSYAWRSLLQSGAALVFGTDCPVEDLNPLPGLYAAVTRRRADGTPPGGWYAPECLTLDEAIYAYTMGPAIASGEQQDKGSLTPGKLADVVVLSRDIYAPPSEAILDTVVEMTLMGGRVIYER